MDIELAHLRTLAEIVRQRSFSRAADHLHLSQPAVSHHVRHLEAAAGVALLERLGKRVSLTTAGELLLEHARRVFRELEAAGQGMQRLGGVVNGRVRVGTGATASIYLLPRLFRQLRRGHPEIELVVVTGNAPDIVAGVLRSELDVGIVTLPVPERRLHVSTFARDPLVAIVPPGREWRGRSALSAAEVARHPLILYEGGGLIRKVIDGWFRAARTRPRIAMELGNAEAIKELVSAGLGISIGSAITVTAEVRRGRLLAIPLTPPLQRDLGIIRRRARSMPPAVSVVVSALEAFAATAGLPTGRVRAKGRPSERRLRRRRPS
jgi:DNA-binding transcriptional LysR family regulator